MAKKVRNCLICGKKYEACHSCEQVITYTPWRRVCDTFEHYAVYGIIKGYQAGTLSKADAKNELKLINVSRKECEEFLPDVKALILEILSEEKKASESKKKEVESEE